MVQLGLPVLSAVLGRTLLQGTRASHVLRGTTQPLLEHHHAPHVLQGTNQQLAPARVPSAVLGRTPL